MTLNDSFSKIAIFPSIFLDFSRADLTQIPSKMNPSNLLPIKNLLCVILALIATDSHASEVDKCALQSDVTGFCTCVCSYIEEYAEDFSRCELGCKQLLKMDGEKEENDVDKRKSSFVRIGRSAGSPLMRRASSFVRIGKSLSSQGIPSASASELQGYTDDVDKRASSFVRIGKSSTYPRYLFKRPSSFVRIGKKSMGAPAARRASSFVRIGKSVGQPLDDVNKRKSSFVRIGKSEMENEAAKRAASSFVRIGKSNEAEALRQHFMTSQIDGLADDGEMKRASNFVRIGKSQQEEEGEADLHNFELFPVGDDAGESFEGGSDEKRASSFVRIGKSGNSFGGKRVSSFVRIGKRSATQPEAAAVEDDVRMR